MNPLIKYALQIFRWVNHLRLVRIEKDLWTEALEPNLEAQSHTQFPDDGVSADDRYSDLLPAPEGSLQITDAVISDSGRIQAYSRSYWYKVLGPDHGLFGDVGSLLQRAISP